MDSEKVVLRSLRGQKEFLRKSSTRVKVIISEWQV